MKYLEKLEKEMTDLRAEYDEIIKTKGQDAIISPEKVNAREELRHNLESYAGKGVDEWTTIDIRNLAEEHKEELEEWQDDLRWLTPLGKELSERMLKKQDEIDAEKNILDEIKVPKKMPDTRRLKRADYEQLMYANSSIIMNAVTQTNETMVEMLGLLMALCEKLGVKDVNEIVDNSTQIKSIKEVKYNI